jgi:hypothetical protein
MAFVDIDDPNPKEEHEKQRKKEGLTADSPSRRMTTSSFRL